MKASRKIGILLVVLLAFGAARMPYERGLMAEFKEQGLIRKDIDLDTRDKIDQTSSAVALGGLRTLVATFLNLRAHVYFSERRWDDLQETFGTIVDLAPNTRYYWETGSWHMSYNAASFYIHDSEMPSLRRREAWRSFIDRGRAFLELGIRNNPNDWSLHASHAQLLSDPNKLPAFQNRSAALLQAADSYARASELGHFSPLMMQRFRFYCLARVEGREQEALQLARSLYADPRHRKPTMLMLLYVLECHADPEQDVGELALKIFGTPKEAYKALVLHWQRTREGYPMDGVAKGLALMEQRLGIPMLESILGQTPPSTPSLDDWFGNDR